jgi:WD40 repeat protein
MTAEPAGDELAIAARPQGPYVGLVPYRESDAPFFFGRTAEASIVAMNLRVARLTNLYGPSGVGKTSLLMAGAVRSLRSKAKAAADTEAPFVVCVFRSWRDDPVQGLREAARAAVRTPADAEQPTTLPLAETFRGWTRRAGTMLVVLDQFEEYFEYHPGERDAGGLTGFAAELARIVNDATLPVHVLLSIRDDAWAKLDLLKGHVPALFAHSIRVDHLDRDAARAAIEGPIAEWNTTMTDGTEPFAIEPKLVDELLEATAVGRLTLSVDGESRTADATDGRIEAPFLQLLLERLWRDCVETGARTLTAGRLNALGGAAAVAENHLLDALDRLTPAEQDTAADCFRYLVSTSRTKIAQTTSDLAEWSHRPEADVAAVLDELCTGESGRILRVVASGGGQGTSYELFHDLLAAPIVDWRRQRERRLAEEAEARRQRVLRQRLVRIVAALGLVALCLAGLAGWALHERAVADSQRHSAESRALALQAHALLPTHIDQAIRLALDARRRADTVEARSALLAAVEHTSGLVRLARFDKPITAIAAAGSADFAVGRGDGRVVLLGPSGRVIGEPQQADPYSQRIDSIAFAPHGRLLALSAANTIELFTARRQRGGNWALHRVRNLSSISPTNAVLAFSRDGRWVAAGGASGVTLYRVDVGGTIRRVPIGQIPGRDRSVGGLGFYGPGPLLAAASAGALWAWNLAATGDAPHRIVRMPATGLLAFGHGVGAAAVRDGVLLWHGVPTATRAVRLPLGGGTPTALALDSSGTLLAVGKGDGTVALWDVADGRPLGAPLQGQGGKIVGLAFEPGSPLLAVAAHDDTVALWNTQVDERRRVEHLGRDFVGAASGRRGLLALVTKTHELVVGSLAVGRAATVANGVYSVASSPDGRRLVVVDETGKLSAGVFDRNPRLRQMRVYSKDASVSGDGVVASVDGVAVKLWEPDGSLTTLVPPPAEQRVGPAAVAISEDGRRVAAYYYTSGAVVLWQGVGGHAPKPSLLGSYTGGSKIVFSPDGSLLAAFGAAGGTIDLWRVAGSGKPTIVQSPSLVTSVAFTPDDRMIAAGGEDHTVRLWDTKSGQSLGDPVGLRGPFPTVTFSPDGGMLVAAHGDVSAWDTRLWQQGPDTFARVRNHLCEILSMGPPQLPATCSP